MYENALKISDEENRREAIKAYIGMKLHEAITQLRMIEEEIPLLQYKDNLEKDPEAKQKHEELAKEPVPKMKVWDIKSPKELEQSMFPTATLKKEKIA